VTDDLVVRAASEGDRRDILDLLARTLDWSMDERDDDFFAWKHEHNVFGTSPAWIAREGDRLVGFRTFLRWEFELNGETIRAMRAVDTATDRRCQRRGVFRRLTLHALNELEEDRATFVFNTPNDQSRPGYLQMGWEIAGRIPLAVRPTGPRGLARMTGARVPADNWSAGAAGGDPAPHVLADDAAISELLTSQPGSRGLATKRSGDYLRWRYGFPPLDYRAVVMPGGVTAGVGIFRVRRRGAAREAAMCEVLVPEGETRRGRWLVREAARVAGADYLVRVAGARDGCVRLPRQGPVLTTRPLAGKDAAGSNGWSLALGDLELF
jgi:hypothetical protein